MVLDNKRGQVVFYTLMLGVCIIVLALSMVKVVNSFVVDARAPTSDTAVGLDCANSSISDFNKAQCVITDLATPYFFFGILGLAGSVLTAKLILDGGTG